MTNTFMIADVGGTQLCAALTPIDQTTPLTDDDLTGALVFAQSLVQS